MPVNKRRKNTRQRGSHTHGWGSKKKHRGAGHQGGAGKAGTGKRGDSKKPSIWTKYKEYFGKHGFVRQNAKKIEAISIRDIEQRLEKLLHQKLIEKNGDFFVLDLKKLGYDKLLSQGIIKNQLKITVSSASKNAIKKIKEKGGEVVLPGKKEESQ